jgi:hypothetical protein
MKFGRILYAFFIWIKFGVHDYNKRIEESGLPLKPEQWKP